MLSSLLGDIAAEIIKETGLGEEMKSKIVDAGVKAVKDMGLDPKNIQRDILKGAIMKELNLK